MDTEVELSKSTNNFATTADTQLPSWIYSIDMEAELSETVFQHMWDYDYYDTSEILNADDLTLEEMEGRIACLRLAPFPGVQTNTFNLDKPWDPHIPNFNYSEDAFISNISRLNEGAMEQALQHEMTQANIVEDMKES